MASNISPNVYDSVLRRDNLTCIYCGFKGDSFDKWRQLTLDHIKPFQYDGSHDETNLATCCHSCNVITAKYHPPENLTKDEMITEKRNLFLNYKKNNIHSWLDQLVSTQ
jgi:5-methylcytosine-specific restriction endonuclease McrA